MARRSMAHTGLPDAPARRRAAARERVLLLLVLAVLLVLCGAPSGAAAASSYIELDSEVYSLLSRLEAEGVISTGLMTIRPISRTEAERLLLEAERNTAGRSGFVREIAAELRHELDLDRQFSERPAPLDSAYVRIVHTDAEPVTRMFQGVTGETGQVLNGNNDGDLYARGVNSRMGLVLRLDGLGPFAFYANPEFASSADSTRLDLRQGYAVWGTAGLDLIAGKESQWWGPGQHGALLLSNNAEPLTLVRLTGPHPVALPGPFRYIGLLQYDLFVTRLDGERSDVQRPYLWGMRFVIKPARYLEIGLERTALLGGSGRPTNASVWLDSVLDRKEHDGLTSPGDQRAGYDVKVTLPFTLQPVQVYWEAVAEDSVHPLPSQWAYLYGLYLPRLLDNERLEFRAEQADTFTGNANRQSTFYLHGIYTDGYTYHSRILGHFIGTDARDEYFELAMRFPRKNGRLSLGFDRVERYRSQPLQEIERTLSLSGRRSLGRHIDIGLACGYGRTSNFGSEPGMFRRNGEFGATAAYRF